MITKGAMAPVRSRRTLRSMLVLALLALAGGGPAPRGAYAEVSAATFAVHSAAVARAKVAAVAPQLVPQRAVAPAAPLVRVAVAAAPRYLAYCSLLL